MRILFVDDDPDTRALAIRAVAQEFPNAVIREASDLASLEEVLIERPPEILVTDFDLRWTDGIKIFDRVKAANPLCCTVMFTGTGNEELAVRAIKHGFDDYVVKGSKQLRRLAMAVRSAYERNNRLRELGENRELILKELYHRLHNNLQLVISLLRMTEKALGSESDRQQLADLGRRIQALSALQEQFYRSDDFRRVSFNNFLKQLAQNLLEPFKGRIELSTELNIVDLPVDLAVPFGLIANEILTGTLYHAFPHDRAGQISMRLEQLADTLVLTIADDGSEPRERSETAKLDLGISIIRRLATQIEGDVSLERNTAGATWRVSVSL
ncbi:MAG: response regulator [Pseudomonadota bacterium]|jgi:two-component sensor histidine kinase|nr:response regulator [Pseudomonadota bacterium]